MDDEPAVKMEFVSDEPRPAPERPSRYTRSFNGLIVAMVVTVVFVAAYVGIRALLRDQPHVTPEVDYASCVAYLQAADVAVVHPSSLPEGWRASAVHYEPGTPPQWRLAMLTDQEEFVGVVQQEEDLDDLLAEHVDESAQQGEDAAVPNSLGVPVWQTWSDAGGDHAFSAELTSGPLAGQTLLVYGSAPVADQEELIGLLTLDPVGDAANDCDTEQLQ
jgi:hypothetical protein